MIDAPVTAADEPRQEIAFISLLRAAAALMVVYCHLVGGYLAYHGLNWLPNDLVDAFVMKPFAIIQSAGFLGVALFFLVSGFIITHVAMRESRREFAVKRMLRIYPPLAASLLLVAIIEALRHQPPLPLADYALAATLANFVVPSGTLVNPVAWSLAVEVIFYALMLVALRWVKVRPATANAGFTTFVILTLLSSSLFGQPHHLFAISASYVPFLLAGQALYLLWSGRIAFAGCAALTAYAFVAALIGLQTIQARFYDSGNSYGVSFVYAYLIFALCALSAKRIVVGPVTEYVARISYSLYLVHAPVGYLVLSLLEPHIGYTFALAVALAVVFAVSALMFRAVEQPSQRFARWLLRRTGRARPAPVPLAAAASS